MSDLDRYFTEIVYPTVADFAANPMSRRYAFLACVAVYHAIDYMFFPQSTGNRRRQFGAECRDFKIIDRVAHAFKHVESNGQADDNVKASELTPRPPSFLGVMVLGVSRVGDTRGGVTLWNNTEVDLLAAVIGAAAFLRSKASDLTPDKTRQRNIKHTKGC